MHRKEPIRVLIVDDEERFRITATAALQKRGFEVSAVAGGAEALEELRHNGADVVVLDVKMPEMDGNETLREIKTLRPDLQVIMLTGHAAMESALEGWRDQVFAYLTKPCAVEMLAEYIWAAFARKPRMGGMLW